MQNEIVKSVVLTKNKNLYKEEICEGRRESKKKEERKKEWVLKIGGKDKRVF